MGTMRVRRRRAQPYDRRREPPWNNVAEDHDNRFAYKSNPIDSNRIESRARRQLEQRPRAPQFHVKYVAQRRRRQQLSLACLSSSGRLIDWCGVFLLRYELELVPEPRVAVSKRRLIDCSLAAVADAVARSRSRSRTWPRRLSIALP